MMDQSLESFHRCISGNSVLNHHYPPSMQIGIVKRDLFLLSFFLLLSFLFLLLFLLLSLILSIFAIIFDIVFAIIVKAIVTVIVIEVQIFPCIYAISK